MNIRNEVLDTADAVMNADWPAEIVQVLDDFYWATFNKGFDAAFELSDHADSHADRRFLQWIFDRLVNVHGENPNYDYMHKLREIVGNVDAGYTPVEPSL